MVEQPTLCWNARMTYMSAKTEEKQIELYAMDLLWLVAKRNYDGLKQPSDLYFKQGKRKDKRTKKQIIEGLLKGLGGE